MGLSDSRQEPTTGYLFPTAVSAPAGLPGSSTDLSTRAAPSHPEESGDCFCPLLHRRFQASSFSGRLATLILLRNEAETGSLTLRLACLPRKASPAESPPPTLARLLAERAIYKISSFQNIRSARLSLALPKTQRAFGVSDLRKLINFSPSHTAHSVRLASQTSGPRLLLLNFRLG